MVLTTQSGPLSTSLSMWQQAYQRAGREVSFKDGAYPMLQVPLPTGSSVIFLQGRSGIQREQLDVGSTPLLLQYEGAELRNEELARRYNPYAPLYQYGQTSQQVDQFLQAQGKLTPAAIVSQWDVVPALLRFFDRIYVLPPTYSGQSPPAVEPKNSTVLRLLYLRAAGDEEIWSYVEDVCTRLRGEGHALHWEAVDLHDETRVEAAIGEADVVVDQLGYGIYGPGAVAALAQGKLVLSYLREDLRLRLQLSSSGLQSCTLATLYTQLRHYLLNPSELALQKEDALRLFQQYHDPALIQRWLDYCGELETRIAEQQLSHRVPYVMQAWGTEATFYTCNREHRLVHYQGIPHTDLFTGNLLPPHLPPVAPPPVKVEAQRFQWRPRQKQVLRQGTLYRFAIADIPKELEIKKAHFILRLRRRHKRLPLYLHGGAGKIFFVAKPRVRRWRRGKRRRYFIGIQCTAWVRQQVNQQVEEFEVFIPRHSRRLPFFLLDLQPPI